jgi:hypothetical protein
MTAPEKICETCAAFIKVRNDDALGKVGECALEVYRGTLRAGSTCTRYRPKGALAAAPRARAAGEPRRGGASLPVYRSTTSASGDVRVTRPVEARARGLPKEIDIDMDIEDFRRVLREVLKDELGISRPQMVPRWQGGEVILKPGKEGTAEKRIPIDNLFNKVVMIRDRLRLLEAKLNASSGLSSEEKVLLQSYITGCYGSLTTFNVLFADQGDQFVGAKGD